MKILKIIYKIIERIKMIEINVIGLLFTLVVAFTVGRLSKSDKDVLEKIHGKNPYNIGKYAKSARTKIM
jgi:hypothetical protein